MNKQVLWIIIILLLLAACGVLLFVLFFGRQNNQFTTGSNLAPTPVVVDSQATMGNNDIPTAPTTTTVDAAARKTEIQPLIEEVVNAQRQKIVSSSAGRDLTEDEANFLGDQQGYALEVLVKQGKIEESDKQLFE